MSGLWVRVWLYTAVLATGAAFCILFSGDTPNGFEGDFAAGSPALALGAFGMMLGAAIVAVLVGSAGKFRFVLIFPAAVVYTLLAVYGRIPLFSLSGWRDLFIQVASDAIAGANTMYGQPIPYDSIPGLFIILIPIVIIVSAFAVSATLYEESPIFSVAVLGVTIGVLSTISFEDGAGPFFLIFLLCVIALLLAVGSSTGDYGSEDSESASVSRFAWPSVVAGAVVAVVVLALPNTPLADQVVSEGAIDWTRIGAGSTSNLNVQADVGDYLTVGQDVPIMRVESDEQLLWRGGTLDRFDGVRWEDTTGPGDGDGDEIAPDIETRVVQQEVEIIEAQTDLVFGGYRIVQATPLNSDTPDAIQSSDSSWRAEDQLSEGDRYRVLSEIPQPTAEQLRSAGNNYPSEVSDRFLQMPESTPDAVADTVQDIEQRYAGASTHYDKARNIERYLRTDGGFTYNLDVNYRRADKAIEEFLSGDKEGFCTQFATSMALLAREQDIPSRVVYGTTTGDLVEGEENEYLVKGGNVHTWVELYFPGVGWYPFDPTPGFSVPATMEQNAPGPQSSSSPQEEPGIEDRNLRKQQQERQNAQEENPPEEKNKDKESSANNAVGVPIWPLYPLAPILLIAAVPLTKRLLVSQGRPEDLYRDLLGRGRDLSPGGNAGAESAALTPNERMVLLAGSLGLDEEPFREFGRSYTGYLYSGVAYKSSRRQVSASHKRCVDALEKLPVLRRWLAAVNPASLVPRAVRGVGEAERSLVKRLSRHR
ncbi:MAG: transglutaminaseTgpA domain-containing protein [Rubrobacteraceae bacterium]